MNRCPRCGSYRLSYSEGGMVRCNECRHTYRKRNPEFEYTIQFSDGISNIPVTVTASNVDQAKRRAIEVMNNMSLRYDENPRVLNEAQMKDEMIDFNRSYGLKAYRDVDSYARDHNYIKEGGSYRNVYEPQYYFTDGISRNGRRLKNLDRKPRFKPVIDLRKKR